MSLIAFLHVKQISVIGDVSNYSNSRSYPGGPTGPLRACPHAPGCRKAGPSTLSESPLVMSSCRPWGTSSTSRARLCSSFTSTSKDSGAPGSRKFSPFTIASYVHAAHHVVGLHGQKLLKRVGGAVGLQRPHFHPAEPLSAELRLASQRLLGDQREGPSSGRASCRPPGGAASACRSSPLSPPDRTVPRAAVVELCLAACGEPRPARGWRFRLRSPRRTPDFATHMPSACGGPPRWVSRICPTFMRGRHPERVQHDFHGRAVRQVRHVLPGRIPGDHALVAAAPHPVPDGELALHRDVDLDHLDDARGEVVAAPQPPDALLQHRGRRKAI